MGGKGGMMMSVFLSGDFFLGRGETWAGVEWGLL